MIATRLGQIAPRGDTELKRKRLEQDRHQVREHDDGEERVIVLRAAREIRGPIARVHVANGDEKSRTGESEKLAQKTGGWRDQQAAMDFGEAGPLRGTAPPGC